MVNAGTNLYCIFGNPVRHSFSPAIQNAAFAETGIDAVYVAFEVTDVAASVAAMRTLGIRGASVTIPHKVEVINHIDEVEDIAAMIGSVNTLINRDGKITGTNTDAYGFYRALSEKTSIDGKTVAVFGSGGGSRAACFSLFHYAKPERLYIFVREADRGECERMRANLLQKLGLDEPQVISRRLTDWDSYKNECDILVNTTPLGMHPDVDASVIPGDAIPEGRVAMDFVYNPGDTLFLREAKKRGCEIVYGADMLLYQGVRQFELWTGKDAPVEVMRKALLGIISK